MSEPTASAGTLDAFAALLADRCRAVEHLLAGLPPKPERDAGQQRLAADALASARDMRRAFMARHAEAVYRELTDDLRRPLRLGPLAEAAAERFPGLVPTPAQLERERARPQADKDGLEKDQAVFFAALFHTPAAGEHLIDAMLAPAPESLAQLPAFRATGRLRLPSVLLERRGSTAELTLDNQHCLNAEDNRLVADMETAVDLVALDDQVRVGVIRGAVMSHPRYLGRRVFSAGINLADLRDGALSYVDFLLGRELGCVGKLVHGVVLDPTRRSRYERAAHKPWLAAVDTFAIGGGTQILLACDRVIAAQDAYFSLPAAHEGIVPGLANLRLGRLTGARLARRIVLGGHVVHAGDPEAALLCDEVVPPEEMDTAIERAAADLAAPAVAANRFMLNLADEPIDQLRRYLAEFAIVQAERLYSADVLDKVERRWARSRAGR
ncbi:(3,5-dihydroxyphenyl)acetyl-CoA 1,2-dioxygenase DpgC [Kitasatospora sp. NPDC049285]|uniref:(3,5-dihydroxyphenyl)acetyl-CoA 1,2-dioxygenase DpgC n=1 Tax=Kitasatospora sp. NPDC049285 TaxID=3157096 RepID=UPI00342B3A66